MYLQNKHKELKVVHPHFILNVLAMSICTVDTEDMFCLIYANPAYYFKSTRQALLD